MTRFANIAAVRQHVDGRPAVVLYGTTSVIGWTLCRILAEDPIDLIACCNRHNRDPRADAWRRINAEIAGDWRFLDAAAADLMIHCGGICDVDRCEAHSGFAHRVNVGGVEAMLGALPARTRLIYLSSDHVFGGRATPFVETDSPAPISVYGQTRVEAERRILETRPDALIVRLGLPIGPSFDGRRGHLDWLRSRHRRGLPMTVVRDERRSAVWARDAAKRILALAARSCTGIRHITATRAVDRPQLAAALCRRLELPRCFDVASRRDQAAPHLGNVDLGTVFTDPLSAPLPCPADDDPPVDRPWA